MHPGDHAQSRRQTLQQQADDGGAQQHPEELRGRAGADVRDELRFRRFRLGEPELLSFTVSLRRRNVESLPAGQLQLTELN